MDDKKYKQWLDDYSNRHHPDFDGKERFSLTWAQLRGIINEELLLVNEKMKVIMLAHTSKSNCSCINTAISHTAYEKDKEWSEKIREAIKKVKNKDIDYNAGHTFSEELLNELGLKNEENN